MISDPTHPMPGTPLPTQAPRTDPQAEYQLMREELQRLLSEPVKNYPRIDELVDDLERLQLIFKQQHGIKGNNPNE